MHFIAYRISFIVDSSSSGATRTALSCGLAALQKHTLVCVRVAVLGGGRRISLKREGSAKGIKAGEC